MIVKINNRETSFPDILNLQDLLKKMPLKSMEGIAVAVNDRVILKKEWDSFKINEKDSILIMQAAQGG